LTAAINAGINDAAGRHVSRSAGEYADAAKVEGWPTRAGEQAREELSVMAKLLCQFAGVFNENQKSEVICGN
jgi:hypothetical protein